MSTAQDDGLTRRERQREATFEEIVRASRALLAEGDELTLRAVAAKMGMTAPALYRYVGSYQELVDLVAFEIDKAATLTFAAASDRLPEDDPAGRLVIGVTEFRAWALANPREFSLVFANPVADPACLRRDLVTASASGLFFTDLQHAVWQRYRYDIPAIDELPPAVRESVLDALIPARTDHIATEDRGLLWTYIQGWTQLYGVVTLEVFGHMDPRIIESGDMFIDIVSSFAPRIGLADEVPRLQGLIREHLAR